MRPWRPPVWIAPPGASRRAVPRSQYVYPPRSLARRCRRARGRSLPLGAYVAELGIREGYLPPLRLFPAVRSAPDRSPSSPSAPRLARARHGGFARRGPPAGAEARCRHRSLRRRTGRAPQRAGRAGLYSGAAPEVGVDKSVDVAVEDTLNVAGLRASTQVLDHLVGVEDVGADLGPEAD